LGSRMLWKRPNSYTIWLLIQHFYIQIADKKRK